METVSSFGRGKLLKVAGLAAVGAACIPQDGTLRPTFNKLWTTDWGSFFLTVPKNKKGDNPDPQMGTLNVALDRLTLNRIPTFRYSLELTTFSLAVGFNYSPSESRLSLTADLWLPGTATQKDKLNAAVDVPSTMAVIPVLLTWADYKFDRKVYGP